MNERLARQIAFLVEADKLKSVSRRTPLVDQSRLENSAEHATPEARFANAVDRLQPLIQNAHAAGGRWRGQTLVRGQILRRMAPIEVSLPEVWPHVLDVVESFCAAGVLQR